MSALTIPFQTLLSAAQRLENNPSMPWDDLEKLVWFLQLVQERQECPSLVQLLQFLSSVPYEHSRELFMAVRFLMETKTSQGGVSFGMVMESFLRMEAESKRRRYSDDGPPPVPGIPAPVYSLDLWRLVKQVYQFLSSIRPVTRSVLSSHMMMVSPPARYGFYLRSVLHRSNPSLRLVTVSPGMLRLNLRRILTNAARSRQNCQQIKGILKKHF
jgi:hypothetical protein